MVDYTDCSRSSSSDKISRDEIGQPGSPDSKNEEADKPIKNLPNESPGGNPFAEAYMERENHPIKADDLKHDPKSCTHHLDSSLSTVAAQESKVDRQQGMPGFDLNQEVCSEGMDNQVIPVSTPISVSVSRPAASHGFPVAPLQFEGALGWKGSAATSAFSPASPHRIPNIDNVSVAGTGSLTKQRKDCIIFDLNVAEDVEDTLADPMSGKKIPASELQSGESLEVNPRKSERPKLDLNRIDDDDDGEAPTSDLRIVGRLPQNGRSLSRTLSSLSKQLSMRNIDLNDKPLVHHDLLDRGPYNVISPQNVRPYGGLKPDDSVISIMGTRVEVNRRGLVPQALPLSDGKASMSGMETNITGTGTVHGIGSASNIFTPFIGYNRLKTGPTMSLSSAVYGPGGGTFPYMVDSRGAPVVPQIIGSTSVVPTYSQPFIMGKTSASPSLNGTSHPNFDLNNSIVIGGNRESGGLKQFLVPGRGIEDHFRANSQPSSSSGVGKRKEPDGGREAYPFSYKHQQPPRK